MNAKLIDSYRQIVLKIRLQLYVYVHRTCCKCGTYKRVQLDIGKILPNKRIVYQNKKKRRNNNTAKNIILLAICIHRSDINMNAVGFTTSSGIGWSQKIASDRWYGIVWYEWNRYAWTSWNLTKNELTMYVLAIFHTHHTL